MADVEVELLHDGGQPLDSDHPLHVQLVSNGGTAAFVKTTAPAEGDAGLVVRQAGATQTWIVTDDGPVSESNRLPVESHLTDGSGAEYSTGNRLPVDIGTVSVEASFDSIISAGNSTTTPLAADAVFTGPWEEVVDYASISTLMNVDQICTIHRQFSLDGVTVDLDESAVTAGGFVTPLSTPPLARYFRLRVENGPTAMGVFRVETAFHFTSPSEATSPVAAPTDDLSTVTSAKSLLHARVPPDGLGLGVWKALKASLDGVLSVALEGVSRMRGENTSTTGVLLGASGGTAAQVYTAGPGRTALMVEVPEGHSSTQIRLYGTFSAGSQVFFEGSADGTDDSWFSLNQRRNTGAADNDETTLLDVSPFGGPGPTGGGNSNWRGSPGGVRFFRVRCGTYTPGDAISVRITTSTAGGPIFQQGPPPLPSDRFATGTFTGTNQSVTLATSGTGSFAALLTGQWTGKVLFEQTIDGVTWRATSAIIAPGQTAQFIAGTGAASQNSGGRGSSAGTRQIRMRTDTDFVGNVSLSLRAGGGTFAVALTSPVQVGALYQGSQTLRQTVGTAAVRLDPSALAVRSTVEVLYQATGAANNGVVYVGFTNGVLPANGRALQPGEAWTLDVNTSTQLWAVASAAGQQVQVTELG